MQPSDIIMINVTGTNGETRHQKTITRQFDGAGTRLDDNGKPDLSTTEVLRNLPSGTASTPPEYPQAQYTAALAKIKNPATVAEGTAELKAIQIAYANQIATWEKQQGGGNEKLQIAKSVLEFTKEFHGFREEDGNHFVMKMENLDVTTVALNDGRTMYQITGTAVFGNELGA